MTKYSVRYSYSIYKILVLYLQNISFVLKKKKFSKVIAITCSSKKHFIGILRVETLTPNRAKGGLSRMDHIHRYKNFTAEASQNLVKEEMYISYIYL
jgi:hypothetical protein